MSTAWSSYEEEEESARAPSSVYPTSEASFLRSVVGSDYHQTNVKSIEEGWETGTGIYTDPRRHTARRFYEHTYSREGSSERSGRLFSSAKSFGQQDVSYLSQEDLLDFEPTPDYEDEESEDDEDEIASRHYAGFPTEPDPTPWREHVDDWIHHFPDEPPQPEEDSAKSDLRNYWAEPAAPVSSSVAMLTTAASTVAI